MIAISPLLLLSSVALAMPQDAPPKPQQPPPAQPQVSVSQPTPVLNRRAIESVREYRGYETAPNVRRWEDVRDLDMSRVDFDAPVIAKVSGRPITQEEFQLWLAFTGGQNGILRSQLVSLTRQAVKRILQDGADAEAFAVADEDVEAKLRAEEEMARGQGEEALAQYKERIESTLGWERYREFVRAHLQSERLLLPPIKPLEEGGEDDASGLPVEAADLLADQPELRDYLNNAYLTGQELPALFRTQFLRMLQEKMIELADIQYAIETPLDQGIYMTINGDPVLVKDVLAFVHDSREVREKALRLMILYRAIDAELAKLDAVLEPDEFELVFEAHDAEYRNTLFPLRNLIGLRGFLNMPEYREYYRRRAAYQQKISDEPSLEDELRAHHEKFGRLFYESGKVTVETLFSSLLEAEKEVGTDPDVAWAKCLERAQNMYLAVQSGESFESVKEQFGGHPLPAEVQGPLTDKMRNEVRQYVGDTEYAIFLNGYSIADDLFYNRVEGEVLGPVKISSAIMPGMKNNMGYLICRVKRFGKTSDLKPFDQARPLVMSDYFDLRFIHFGQECLKRAEIELTERNS